MNHLLIKTTACYNNANGGYTPSKRANIHGRINHKAGKYAQYHIESIAPNFRDGWTKQQKLEDYEYRCIERGIKPFHYTQAEYEQVLAEIADDEQCAERDFEFQQNYIY